MLLDSIETKEKILQEFLQIASFEGWNKESLLQALDKCQISRDFCNLVFENDILDLTEFYIISQNQNAQKLVAQIDNFKAEKIRSKIRLSLYARFEVEKDNKIALQRLVNFYLNYKNLLSFKTGPRPLFYALRDCYKIADSIWVGINDQSTDFNFYTKRLTLSKIILRSLFVFVKDEDSDFQKTKNFIDAEIEKVMKFEKLKSQVKKISNKAQENFCQFILDEKGSIKSPKELIKKLPFIRLIKF
jgi:ubiquinone biosynthesis protein COQ9